VHFDFLYNICLQELSDISQMFIGLHVKYSLVLSVYDET